MSHNYYYNLEWEYGIACKMTCKKYKNNHQSLQRAKRTRNFLIRCRKDRIIPTFIMNRTKDLVGYNRNNTLYGKKMALIQRTQRTILNLEISFIFKRIHKFEKISSVLRQKMYKLAPQHIMNEFIHSCKKPKQNQRNNNNMSEKQMAKFNKLVNEQTPMIKHNPDWFKNLSSVVIPEEIELILSLGPKFSVVQTKKEVPICNIISDVEDIISINENREIQNTIRGKVATVIMNHMHKTDHQINRRQQTFHRAQRRLKLFLKKNT